MFQKSCAIGIILASLFSAEVEAKARSVVRAVVKHQGAIARIDSEKGRTAVLSITGEVRTESKACQNQLENIVLANPEWSFKVYYVADGTVDTGCMQAMKDTKNVREVRVVSDPATRDECKKFPGMETRPCSALIKQYIVYKFLRGAVKADAYLHTRFDVTLDRPLDLRDLNLDTTLYVLRCAGNGPHSSAQGDVDNQETNPILWYFQKPHVERPGPPWDLTNSVSDFFFVGKWEYMSVVLSRFEFFADVYNGKTEIGCGRTGTDIHGKPCLQRQEELLVNHLTNHNIRVRFAKPVTAMVRR